MIEQDVLNDLSDRELFLLNKVKSNFRQSGNVSFPTANDYVEFADYTLIHNEYLALYETTTDKAVKTETLKRLIFLNWYYCLEPNHLTGIILLDNETMLKAYKILNDTIKNNGLDAEFKWMLSFYSSWDYVIFQFSEGKLNELTAFVNQVDNNILHCPEKLIINATMENRGQMGIYWKSITK